MKTLSEADSLARKRGTQESTHMRKKTARSVVIGITLVITLGLATFYVWQYVHEPRAATVPARAKSQAEICSRDRPCQLTLQTNGQTAPVHVPAGKSVCFDPSFWQDLPNLGYRTAYRGGPLTLYPCTMEEVLSGSCTSKIFDTFSFAPRSGTSLPGYWFEEYGRAQC